MTEYNILCDKYGVKLKKNKINKRLVLELSCVNEKYKIQELVNINIYNLIAKINSDLLDKVEIINKYDDENLDMLIIFNRFGSELGIPKKYMYVNVKCIKNKNLIKFVSKDLKYEKEIENCEQITNSYSDLSVTINNEHNIDINYEFEINMNEDLPIYMEDYLGLLMKKLFIRLKTFIEKMI